MRVKRVEMAILFVHDMDAQLAWYEDVLGLKARMRHGDWAVLDVGGDAQLAMHGGAESPAASAGQRATVVLEVDDYAATKAELVERGVPMVFENETPRAMFGTIRDPEGIEIQLLQTKV